MPNRKKLSQQSPLDSASSPDSEAPLAPEPPLDLESSPGMVIGVISDTHLLSDYQQLPEWVLRAFAGVDLILHAGDIEHTVVLQTLATIAPVYAVRGNCDRGLSNLPPTRLIRVPGGELSLAHRREHAWYAASPATIALVFGHTHIAQAEFEHGRWLLNPGSPLRPRGGKPPSVMLINIQNGKLEATFKYPEPCADG